MINIRKLREEISDLISQYGESRFAFLTGSYVHRRKTSSDLDLVVVYSYKFDENFLKEYIDYQRRRGFHPDQQYPCELIREDNLTDLLDVHNVILLRQPIQKNLKKWNPFDLSLLYATQLLWGDGQVVDGNNELLKSFKRRSMLYLSQVCGKEIHSFDRNITSPLSLPLTDKLGSLWRNITNPKGLLFFDAGGTLIYPVPIYDLFNEEYDLWEEDNKLYAQYKSGGIDSGVLFHKTIQLYKKRNLKYEDFLRTAEKLSINRELESTIKHARNNGWITVCLSGGLQICLEHRVGHLFDSIISNKIIFERDQIKEGRYTLSDKQKFSQVVNMAGKISVPLENVVYVGDEVSDFLVRQSLPRAGGRYFDFHETERLNRLLYSS